MQTLKLKARPANSFFATVNQMFGASSQLPTTAKCTNHVIVHSSDKEAVFGSSRKLGVPAEHLIDSTEKRIYHSTFEIVEHK